MLWGYPQKTQQMDFHGEEWSEDVISSYHSEIATLSVQLRTARNDD
jgi:hypothetical protein